MVQIEYTTAPSCPHCGRELEDPAELAAGLCTSNDCRRHDAPDLVAAARALVHTLQGMALHPSHYADLVAALAATDAAAQAAERNRRLATLDYSEHELVAIRSALAATRCTA